MCVRFSHCLAAGVSSLTQGDFHVRIQKLNARSRSDARRSTHVGGRMADSTKSRFPAWVKALVCLWMLLAVFVNMLLFGPPEFWLFVQRLGVLETLQAWASWLQPFLRADYLS